MSNKLKAQLSVVAAISTFAGAALLAGNPVLAVVVVGVFFLFVAAVFADLINEENP